MTFAKRKMRVLALAEEGHSQSSIAKMLGCTTSSVAGILHRNRRPRAKTSRPCHYQTERHKLKPPPAVPMPALDIIFARPQDRRAGR